MFIRPLFFPEGPKSLFKRPYFFFEVPKWPYGDFIDSIIPLFIKNLSMIQITCLFKNIFCTFDFTSHLEHLTCKTKLLGRPKEEIKMTVFKYIHTLNKLQSFGMKSPSSIARTCRIRRNFCVTWSVLSTRLCLNI